MFALIACVLLPRFELAVAAGGRAALMGEPAALAPEPGREQLVGQVSASAETFGVRPGMRLGRRWRAARGWRWSLPTPRAWRRPGSARWRALEGMGAAVEPERPGLACFDAGALRALYGGLDGTISAVRRALPWPARVGAGPTRFCALAAAARARPRRAEIVPGHGSGAARAYLAGLPVGLLRARERLAELPEPLERLGIRTLGELAALSRAAVADRFGALGLTAHDLACGHDGPLVPRSPRKGSRRSWSFPRRSRGLELERALDLLVGRLLARRERRGRTVRAAVLERRPGGGRHLARARGLPRGARRSRPHAPGARAAPGAAARSRGVAAPGRRALRAARRRPAPAARGRRRRPRRPPARGGAPGARRRGRRRRPARPARGPALASPRASSGSNPLRPAADGGPRSAHAPAPAKRLLSPSPPCGVRPAPDGARWRWTGGRWTRCASPGWWRIAGGPTVPCAAATGRSSPPAGAAWSSSTSWGAAAGTGNARHRYVPPP